MRTESNAADKESAARLTVHVIPRSSRSEIVGERGGAIKVKLTSPPVDGAANAELIELLAKKLGVPKANVRIVAGHNSKTKQLSVTGTTPTVLERLLRA